MNPLTHVYYDQLNNQMVLFQATLDSKYTFEFESGETRTFRFWELESFEDRQYYLYLGSLENEFIKN